MPGRDRPVAAAARHSGVSLATAGAAILLQPPAQPGHLCYPSNLPPGSAHAPEVLKPLLTGVPRECSRILEMLFAWRCLCGLGALGHLSCPVPAAAPEAAAPAVPPLDLDGIRSVCISRTSSGGDRTLLWIRTQAAKPARGAHTGRALPSRTGQAG